MSEPIVDYLGKPIEDYLGDGVYASFDGCYLKLDLRGQDSTTEIFLEPEVFERLLQFRKNAIKEIRSRLVISLTGEPDDASASSTQEHEAS
jgi:hypothetical protein